MAKAGTIYFLEDNKEDPGGRPNTVFVGSGWDMKKNPDDPRKVLSFTLRGEEQGVWHKLTALTYEDGTVIDMTGKTLLWKPATGEQTKREDFSF